MNKEELLDLIKTGEGYTLEFKENIGSDLGREICAFANSSGGKIVLGAKDDGEIAGIKTTNSLKSQIQSFARNIDPSFSVETEEVGNFLVIHVPEGQKKPYSVNGRFFLRVGANSQQLNRDEVRDFFQDEGSIQFDEKLNQEFGFHRDFNKAAYVNFLKKGKINASMPAVKLLSNIGFVKNNRMTNAGVLFFCKNVSKFFLNAHITCVLFQGTDKSIILDKQEFNFDLITNYDKTMEYLKSKLNTEFYIRKYREEFLELPENALREAILNALAHRDYFSPAHIQVNIFNDRVEITNPASFPSKITLADLLSGSHPKNRLLFYMMQRADLAEEVGSGIRRIKSEMRSYKLDPPKFEYTGVWFIATLNRPDLQVNSYQKRTGLEGTISETAQKSTRKVPESIVKLGEKLGVKLGENEEKIITMIAENKFITSAELSEKIGISTTAVENNIAKLKKKGLLERIGPAKGGHWKVVEK